MIFKKFVIKVNFSSFLANFQFRAEEEKVTSRAENTSARALARASSARTHHYWLPTLSSTAEEYKITERVLVIPVG